MPGNDENLKNKLINMKKNRNNIIEEENLISENEKNNDKEEAKIIIKGNKNIKNNKTKVLYEEKNEIDEDEINDDSFVEDENITDAIDEDFDSDKLEDDIDTISEENNNEEETKEVNNKDHFNKDLDEMILNEMDNTPDFESMVNNLHEENISNMKEIAKKNTVNKENESSNDDEEEDYDDMKVTPISNNIDKFEKIKNKSNENNNEGKKEDYPVLNEDIKLIREHKTDLENIEFTTDYSEMDLLAGAININNHKAVKRVVCAQSYYAASMTSLDNRELQRLNEDDVDLYTTNKKFYEMVYRHMTDISIGKISFEQFIRNTTTFDFPTLVYGIYCQTFPFKNKYNLRCTSDKCGKLVTLELDNNELVYVPGKEQETVERVKELLPGIKTIKDMKEHSLIHTTNRISVPNTEYIFDIRIPSIYNELEEVTKHANKETINEFGESIFIIAPYIHVMYIPNIKILKETGKLIYFKVTDRYEIMQALKSSITFDDLSILIKNIGDFITKYTINYKIQNIICPHCGHEIGDRTIDIQDFLFRTIERKLTDSMR